MNGLLAIANDLAGPRVVADGQHAKPVTVFINLLVEEKRGQLLNDVRTILDLAGPNVAKATGQIVQAS